MPIGSGKVTVLNERFVSKQKVTPIARPKDNTTDIENGVLAAHQQFAHISRPDDYSGKRSRRGSLDMGDATKFSGTVYIAPGTAT